MRKQAFRTVAASAMAVAGVTAAGSLANMASASPSPSGWAALRQCESGGNYGIDTGNGYYGAYQFNASTWHSMGYSGLPSDASPATQDQAAQRLYAERGSEPWPVCGAYLGSGGSGSGSTASTSDSGGSSAPSNDPAPASLASPSFGGSYSAPASNSVPADPPADPPATASGVTYTVRHGDTLSAIATHYGTTVAAIAQANHLSDPDLIFGGQVLSIPQPPKPPTPSTLTYTVHHGDTLSTIATHYGTTVAAIVQANHLVHPDLIFGGQVLSV